MTLFSWEPVVDPVEGEARACLVSPKGTDPAEKRTASCFRAKGAVATARRRGSGWRVSRSMWWPPCRARVHSGVRCTWEAVTLECSW